MATQRYSVTSHPIETLLTWVKSGEIAMPDYDTFLAERRRLMALKIKQWFEVQS